LNGDAANWIRVVFPVVIIGLGSALYGRFNMSPIEVNKTPTRIVCDPTKDDGIMPFRDSFIKTYWFLLAFTVVVLARPFIEANYNLFGISPSMPFGFPPGDQHLIFGQNPAISLISLLTLGFSNLMGINKTMRQKLKEPQKNPNDRPYLTIINGVLAAILAVIISAIFVFRDMSNYIIFGLVIIGVLMFIMSYFVPDSANPFYAETGIGKSFATSIRTILLMPVLRWDVLYLMAKYGFGLAGLIYAGFSIRDFNNIPEDDPCMYTSAYIRHLYLAFIVFLIVFYSFNTFGASSMTSALTGVMRFLVPTAMLGLASYLVNITYSFTKLAPRLVIH